MRIQPLFHAALLLALAGGISPAHALDQNELVARIKAAGYSQLGEVKSTAEGTVVRAKKDGKDVLLVVDSSGQIKEQK